MIIGLCGIWLDELIILDNNDNSYLYDYINVYNYIIYFWCDHYIKDEQQFMWINLLTLYMT